MSYDLKNWKLDTTSSDRKKLAADIVACMYLPMKLRDIMIEQLDQMQFEEGYEITVKSKGSFDSNEVHGEFHITRTKKK